MSIKIEGFPPSTAGITGALVYRGELDPTSPPADITSASKGDFYVVSAVGTLATVDLNINDHIVFNQDAADPLTAAMFDKIDNTEPTASETVAGIIEISTNAEATAGTATDKALVPSNLSSVGTSQLNNDAGFITSGLQSGDNVSELVNDAGYLTSVAAASETVQGIIEISTNAEATAGTATDKALVPSNLSSVGTSQLNNDAGFITSYTETDTLNSVVSRGATTATSITTGGLEVSGDITADADASRTIGEEATRFISFYGDVNGALRFKAKNDSGGAIAKGETVYIKGISGTVPTVDKARSNSAATMASFGLAFEAANDQAELQVITFGNLEGLDTSSFSAGDTVFISSATAGALVNTAPTGEANLIQNIGRVLRSHATDGIIKVGGAGRSNATPNLDQNKVFLGNASNQAVSTALSSINLSSFNNDAGFLTSVASSSETVAGIIEISTNAEATTGTATDKALVPSNLSSVGTSQLNNDAGFLTSVSAASETVAGIIEIATNAEATTGTATDKALVPSNLSSVGTSQLNNDAGFITSGLQSGDNVSELVNDAGYLTSVASASETVQGIIEISTNAEATTGTATDKALVPSNISSIGTSQLNNDAGFITDISAASETVAGKIEIATNAEATAGSATDKALVPSNISSITLNQLDEVSYTAGSSINDYVLTYVDANGQWEAKAATGGGGGGSRPTVTEITAADYNISDVTDSSILEEIYVCDTGASTVTLPTAASREGLKIQIKNRISSAITVDTVSSQTIDGASTVTISSQYESLTFVSDNSNWNII